MASSGRVRQRELLLLLVATLLLLALSGWQPRDRFTWVLEVVAEVPFGFWMRDALGVARNHYDRIGHFAQGFMPAMIAREILHAREILQ